MKPIPTYLALSQRLYRLLLHLYPTPFRRAFGAEMAQVFRDDVRGTLQAGGRAAVVGLWLVMLFDLLKTAAAEHVWEVFHMPIEKMTRWSGPAGAMGGLLFSFSLIWMEIQTGFADGSIFAVIGSIVALVTIPLYGLALYGLSKSVSGTGVRLAGLLFGASVLGLFTLHAGWVLLVWTNNLGNIFPWEFWEAVAGVALTLWLGGFALLGIAALVKNALGSWSFSALLVPGIFGVILILSTGISPVSASLTFLLTVYSIAWLLFGLGLWLVSWEPNEPGLLA